jgi:hypothetical protein
MNTGELIAIDVHTHAEVSCRQPTDEVWQAYEDAAVHGRFRTRAGVEARTERGGHRCRAREQRHDGGLRQHRSAQGQDGSPRSPPASRT